MNKSRMRSTDRSSDIYLKEVESFLQFAFKQSELEDENPCPCKKCNNVFHKSRDEQNVNQGEEGKEPVVPSQKKRKERGDDMFEMIYDVVGPEITNDSSGVKYKHGDASESTSIFSKLSEDAAQQLYIGCETFSKLSLIVELFQIKCLYGLSGKAVDSILNLFKRALPSGETLPESFYGEKKVIQNLGLHYEKIHACENDFMLFLKHNAKEGSCLICGESRLKSVEGQKLMGILKEKLGKKFLEKCYV
ncbi:hypothetical protein KY289_001176 [Solanum tuberosum]|nr:hypothetical protein KY289_001176 [Solanum tuberosum]